MHTTESSSSGHHTVQMAAIYAHTYRQCREWGEDRRGVQEDRRERERVRALIMHTRREAPHLLGQELTCPVCTELVQRPIALTPCSSLLCCECLVKWLHITQDVQCPCCYSGHTLTIKQASTLTQNLLGMVETAYRECGASVMLQNYDLHTCNNTTTPSSMPNQLTTILTRGPDIPLTAIEEQLQSNLARTAMSQNPQSLLQIKTGGDVRLVCTIHIIYMYKEHVHTCIAHHSGSCSKSACQQ